jgi:hypothetical protein
MVTRDQPPEVKLFYIRAARERLERLHERFPPGGKAALHLESLSTNFADTAEAVRTGGKFDLPIGELGALTAELMNEEPRSLYNPDALRAALAR